MGRNISLVLMGFLMGLMVMAAMPTQAHHSRDLRKLKNRVHALEQAFDGGCSFGEPVTWGSSLGNISGDPTLRCDGIDGSDIDVPAGCSDDPAVWTFSDLDC